MILRKVVINGKVHYKKISYEDALKYPNKEELVFTDEDEKDDFEDDLFDIELDEIDEKCEELNNEIDRIEDELDNMERVAKQGIFITLCEMFKKSKKNKK